MTQSGPPPERSAGADQERIWEAPEDDGALEQVTPDEVVTPFGQPAAQPPIPTPRSVGASPAWTQSLTSTAAVPGPAGLTLADVPNRIIAFVLDVIVLAIVGLVLALVVGRAFGGMTSGGSSAGGSVQTAGGDLNVAAFLVVALAQLALSFGYFAYSWVLLRGTLGMKMLSLQVGDQSDGHSISWDQALIRWLLLGIAATLVTFPVFADSLLGRVLGILGFAWLVVLLYSMAQHPGKQGLHDRYARTILVRAGRRPA
jgi:uncharacterized RDD family membrane protein YckC